MDVKTTFLHGSLDEELYMLQPEWFLIPKCCKLWRTLYGLKQGLRLWYKNLILSCFQMASIKVQQILRYMKKEINGTVLLFWLRAHCRKAWHTLKCKLKSAFSTKDLGNAKHILGIRIRQDRQKELLFVSQEKYVEKVPEWFQRTDRNFFNHK